MVATVEHRFGPVDNDTALPRQPNSSSLKHQVAVVRLATNCRSTANPSAVALPSPCSLAAQFAVGIASAIRFYVGAYLPSRQRGVQAMLAHESRLVPR